MTSKEALRKLNFECIRSNGIDDEYHEELNIIEKDLKILEILKKYIYYSPKTCCIRMIDIYKRPSNFDYEELKKWLEDVLKEWLEHDC